MKGERKTGSMPLVSVVIVSMNRKKLLQSCLVSVANQRYAHFEIIVVDNASTDGTGAMVQRDFPEVRYFPLDANVGPPGGRNHGVRMSKGEICVFIDDDAVFMDRDALDKVVSYFDADARLGCIAFRVVVPADGTEEYKSIPRLDKKILFEDYECSYFCGAGCACRRLLFLEAGLFWEPLFFIAEELDLSYRLVNRGYRIVRSFSISVLHYETPEARVEGKWIYYGVRSRFWIAIRHLPWPNAFSHTLLWWGYFFIAAMRYRYPRFFFRGVLDAALGFSQAFKDRTCISQETMRKIKALSGRVYY